MHGVVVLLLAISLLGNLWKPEWPGLFQRISFVGMYLWMWLVVLAISRETKRTGEPESNRLDAAQDG